MNVKPGDFAKFECSLDPNDGALVEVVRQAAAEDEIRAVLIELQAKTKLCPRAVSFDLLDVTTLLDDGRRLYIRSLRIELEPI